MSSKAEAVYEMLLTYPMLQYMYFNFGNAEDGATFLLYDNDTVLKEYADGSKEHCLVYQIAPFKDFSTDVMPAENLQDFFDVEQFQEWIVNQSENGNLPAFDGCSVWSMEVGDLTVAGEDPDNNLAKYMFPLKIYYMED